MSASAISSKTLIQSIPEEGCKDCSSRRISLEYQDIISNFHSEKTLDPSIPIYKISPSNISTFDGTQSKFSLVTSKIQDAVLKILIVHIAHQPCDPHIIAQFNATSSTLYIVGGKVEKPKANEKYGWMVCALEQLACLEIDLQQFKSTTHKLDIVGHHTEQRFYAYEPPGPATCIAVCKAHDFPIVSVIFQNMQDFIKSLKGLDINLSQT